MLFLGFGALALAAAVIWVYALVDALRRPAADWARADQNQIVWILVILLGNALGAVIYLLVAKEALDRAS